MIELISNPERITPQWLTKVLKEQGVLPKGSVTQVSWRVIGTGKMGDNVQFTIGYDHPCNAPATLVAKLPASDETARSMAGSLGAYRREVMFYSELAGQTTMSTPTVYLQMMDQDGMDFVIVMEDLSMAEPGNQLIGETPERAMHAMAEVAKLHAAFHNKTDILERDYLTRSDADGAAFGQELMEQNWPGFKARFGHGLNSECIAFCDDYVAGYAGWATRYRGPKTVIHGDFRSENILFGEGGQATTVDWQTIAESCGVADVSYFLGGSLTTEERRQSERGLVEHYRQALAGAGVNLGSEACWEQYRQFSAHGLVLTILGAMFSEAGTRSDQMFLVMAQRHLQHCVDMNAREFL
ncbi:MAG: phosphotransferase [Halieaceae bacterium]|nr:phosphotransferase [Halieaceae bacterium]